MSQTWWVNAFVGPGAAGNATCVVLEEGSKVEMDRWTAARRLRAPDTVFIEPLTPRSPSLSSLRFFSPQEGEMAFCGQGLIAAEAVLRTQLGVAAPMTLRTRAGAVTASPDPDDAALSWIQPSAVSVSLERSSVAVGSQGVGPWTASVVDSGRRRAFVCLPSESELPAIRLEPEVALGLCRHHGWTGLCFYTITGPGRVALRVFTISLGGGEDFATGGAVLGLGPLLPRGHWEVQQGTVGAFSRGVLFLDNRTPDAVRFGGRVEAVAVGRLLP